MSFILDALRKSEHERQRAAMPGIAQVPFGLPRRELPAWAVAVIVVLAVALLALAGAWWRSSKSTSMASAEPDLPARTEIPLALPPPTVATPPTTVVPTPQGGAPAERAPESAARRGAAVSADAPLADEPPSTEQPPAAALEEPAAADEPTLPSAAALTAEGIALPDLRLELHAYSPRPAERFVFINGSKYLEGATLAEGPRLLTIRPNGAVLVYLGHRFLLAPQ